MWHRYLLVIAVIFPVSLIGQGVKSDTIPFGSPLMKMTGESIIATLVDTTNTLVINEFLARNSGSVFDNHGDDDDWLEIYNYGEDPVLLNTLYFTDDPDEPFKWKIDTSENLYLGKGKHFLIWVDGEPEEGHNHASFKISGEGEFLGIYQEDTSLIDHVTFGPQSTNISFGRAPDGALNWYFFEVPTPGAPNSTVPASEVLPAPFSNTSGGIYTKPFSLSISSPIADATIVYTTDCRNPQSSDMVYREPLQIDSTTIVKARLFKDNAIHGPVLTISVIMDGNQYDNPVISLVADPKLFYGPGGLISSRNSSIEVPAHLEYIENGQSAFSSGTGIQLHSTGTPNSLRLYARSRYGSDWFNFSFFEDEGPDKFKRLILRNSGNDNVNKKALTTHFRDPLIHTIAKAANWKSMVSDSEPVNVYLNGKYHGIFNLRERIDENYITTHTETIDDFDLLELAFGYPGNQHAITGSFEEWLALLSFADTSGNLSQEEDFQYIRDQVDLENFTDYWITEVFAGNYDWLSNNVKFWKPENGKWQWIFWDTDHGLGLQYIDYGNVEWNTLGWSLDFHDRSWPNGYHNILIRNLLKNKGYEEYFIKRFTNLLNTSFSFNSTSVFIDSTKEMYESDMSLHCAHWNNSMEDWEQACTIVKTYLQKRPDEVFKHIQHSFDLESPVHLDIRVEPPGAGKIVFDGQTEPSGSVQGKYFPGMTYSFEASASPGFIFEKWDRPATANNTLEIELSGPEEAVAYFLPSDHSFPIQITEMYGNTKGAYDPGDWIELYYFGIDTLDLEQWYLSGKDDQVLFTFDSLSKIGPGEYIVIAEDVEQFRKVFPSSIRVFGDLNRDLSADPAFSLHSNTGQNMRQVEVGASGDWPVMPSEGYSLELKHFIDHPEFGINWELSENSFGSPGLPNHNIYSFQKPTGKDTTFSNLFPMNLAFLSSSDFYSDPDQHSLGGIFVKSIEGPGKFFGNQKPVSSGKVFEPADFIFQPDLPYEQVTRLTCSFIDQSGQESSNFTINFQNHTGENPESPQAIRLYPIPAQSVCFLEIPAIHTGPKEFYLFDLSGKILQQHHLIQSDSRLRIDLTGLADGIYLYMLKTSQTVVNGKIEVAR